MNYITTRKCLRLGIFTTALAALLVVGCGGGSNSSTQTYPADAGTAGTLPFLQYIFTTDGHTTAQNVTITGAGSASTMSFANPQFTLAAALSSSPVWNIHDGLVNADGNIVSYCSAGSQPTANPATDGPLQAGHNLFISVNLVDVTKSAVIKNVTLHKFDCAGSSGTLTFDAAGSVTNGTTAVPSADFIALTSAAGKTESDGSNNKVRIYKYTSNGNTKYFIVVIASPATSPPSGVGHVALFY